MKKLLQHLSKKRLKINMKFALYQPWIYLHGGLERSLLELVTRSRHEWVVYTGHYEPENTFSGFANIKVHELRPTSINRNMSAVIKSAYQVFMQNLPVTPNIDGTVIWGDGIGDLLTFKNKQYPLFTICSTPLRAAFDPVYEQLALKEKKLPYKIAYQVFKHLFKTLDKRAWKHYTGVVSTSTEVKNRIIAGGLYQDSNKMMMAYPGVDWFEDTSSIEYQPFILLARRIMWTKNIQQGIRAFLKADLPAPWRLVIAGYVDEKSKVYLCELKQLAQTNSRIEFVVSPNDNQLSTLYRTAAFSLFTPLNEDWGIAPLESMTHAKAVIANASGGPKESIVDGKTGFLLSPNDDMQWSAAIKDLALNPDKMLQMGKNAHVHVKQFTWTQFVENVDNALEKWILQKKSDEAISAIKLVSSSLSQSYGNLIMWLKKIKVSVICVCISLLASCAEPLSGVYLHKPGNPIKKVEAVDLPTGEFEYRAAAQDTLLVEVYPRNELGKLKKIEKGNDVHVNFALSNDQYHIAPGDELSFELVDIQQALIQVVVQPDGQIALPNLAKTVRAAGLSLKQLSESTKKYYAALYNDPKPSFSIIRSVSDQLIKLNSDYSVGSDGLINIPNLGKFNAVGVLSSDLEQKITTAATTYFGNNIKATVQTAQNNARATLDTRLSPDGVQYFKNSVKVSADGTIFIPDVGSVVAKDRKLTDLGEQIQAALQPLYQNPIDVHITMQDSVNNGIFIGGEVRIPGRYNFANSASLLQLIALAGWANDKGDLGNVILMHKTGVSEYTVYSTNLLEVIEGRGPANQDLKLLPHDVIVVPPTSIGKANKWVAQYIRDMLPFGSSVTYNFTRPVNQ